ncbi:sulfur reduction protein DsrE [Mangrovimonas sp. YM274]|uniref:sulfur reduction protein DsrE n=1 Tax=Mangrovimonas sp. YM274 TaxID=3070660 RepID=UPI0027DC2D6E|nr:sulfur reduction protein DsrE [Mangrovimonas sp. YM274]WMI70163.1 sulfur reduction protein DsrE [Mangrovimonas sp. YM274]
MKHTILYLFSICLFSLNTSKMKAQDNNSEQHNYLILSKNLQQLKPVLLTANELKQEDGPTYGNFHMIICGKTVSDIPNNSAFEALLKEASSQNVKVFACGISLKKFNVDITKLPKNITIVENGILYGFQLLKQGFITLTI